MRHRGDESRPTVILHLALALILAAGGAGGAAEDKKDIRFPADPEPTPEETLILELMNRFRADPSADADRIIPANKTEGGVDWEMFSREMKALKPQQPLVFNLQLLDAARKHSLYMIHNGLTHVEEAGKTGFVAAQCDERCKKAGYAGGPGGENCFAESHGPLDSHVGFVVDFGQGPGGMQPKRGHRKLMIGDFREVGPGGVSFGKDRFSVTHNFGFGAKHIRIDGVAIYSRFAGGVTYIDANGNAFYDVGEGIGQVVIRSSTGATFLTWKSGAYVLELQGREAVTMTAELAGERVTKSFPAGADNIKFDWRIPPEVPLRQADRLIAVVEKAEPVGSPAHNRALVDLAMGTQGLSLDDARNAKVSELTKDVRPKLEADQKKVLDAIQKPEAYGLQKLLAERREAYRGTAAEDWFRDAEMVARLRKDIHVFLKNFPRPRERRRMAASVEAAAQGLKTPFFQAQIGALVAEVEK